MHWRWVCLFDMILTIWNRAYSIKAINQPSHFLVKTFNLSKFLLFQIIGSAAWKFLVVDVVRCFVTPPGKGPQRGERNFEIYVSGWRNLKAEVVCNWGELGGRRLSQYMLGGGGLNLPVVLGYCIVWNFTTTYAQKKPAISTI